VQLVNIILITVVFATGLKEAARECCQSLRLLFSAIITVSYTIFRGLRLMNHNGLYKIIMAKCTPDAPIKGINFDCILNVKYD
jgi:hypothetical protein